MARSGFPRDAAMGIRRWATRHLQMGDLTTLKGVAKGQLVYDQHRLARLRERGFLTSSNDDSPRITITGRIALAAKRLTTRSAGWL